MRAKGFIYRHSLLFSGVLLLFASTQLLSISISNPKYTNLGTKVLIFVVGPVDKTWHSFSQTIEKAWGRYVWLQNVEEENIELTTKLKKLETENSYLKELRVENEKLKSMLHFVREAGLTGVVANVVSRSPSHWVRTVNLDKGLRDGVKENAAVVDGNTVVGQVIAVTETSAKVLLLSDSSSFIDVLLETSRATGLAQGQLDMPFVLRYVKKEEEVREGEAVLSSGLDGVFPKGALVGRIAKVIEPEAGMFKEIEVTPATAFSKLEHVFVVIRQGHD